MRVTVLGAAASHAGVGEACAGHLVEAGGARVLFDCGNGVLSNLYHVVDPYTLDAIFITHSHPDHFVDLYSLQAMLRYAPDGPAQPMMLYLPAGLYERMQCLLSERGAEEFRSAFTFTVLEHKMACTLKDLEVVPFEVDHTEPTFALRAQADGETLVYTSDTAWGERVADAVKGADLLLAEATLPERYAGMAPHLTAREAAVLARDGGVGQLVLVHLWPTNDRDVALAEATEVFDGPVSVARELDVFEAIRGRDGV